MNAAPAANTYDIQNGSAIGGPEIGVYAHENDHRKMIVEMNLDLRMVTVCKTPFFFEEV